MSTSGVAEVEQGRFAWWADGDGPTLVLVHAGVADARMWEPLLPVLRATHHVVRYDMRGFGRTRSAPGTFADARDLAGLLDALGITRAHLVGASYGGQVALELAATQPARVASLVLLAAALPDIAPTPELQAFTEAEERALDEDRIDDAVDLNVRMWASASTPEIQALVADMQRNAFELQLREGVDNEELDPPASARLADVQAPATIVIGDRDIADFARVAERLRAGLARATLCSVADAGHLLALDQPDAVARLILRGSDA